MIGQPTPTCRKWLTGWRWSSPVLRHQPVELRESVAAAVGIGVVSIIGRGSFLVLTARPGRRPCRATFGRDPLVDLRVLVFVQPLVDDLAPVLGEVEIRASCPRRGSGGRGRFLSACSAVIVIGLRKSGLSGSATCFDAGPWQFSHWLPLRWGVAASDRQPEVYSKPVVWQVMHSASWIVFGLGSFSSDVERLRVLGGGPLHEGVGVARLARLGADERRARRCRRRTRGGGSSRPRRRP